MCIEVLRSCRPTYTRGVACGDRVVDWPEECDDGNTDDGDGCSAECHREVWSCRGLCGQAADGCHCDIDCAVLGDCCDDYVAACGEASDDVRVDGSEESHTDGLLPSGCGCQTSGVPAGISFVGGAMLAALVASCRRRITLGRGDDR
jgi:cysteine-rich repeat protein